MIVDILLIILIAVIGGHLATRRNIPIQAPNQAHKYTGEGEGEGEGIYRLLNMDWRYKGV